MTNPDDKNRPAGPDLTPQGNAPSWVDEVLHASQSAPRPAPVQERAPAPEPLSGLSDLRLPETPRAGPPRSPLDAPRQAPLTPPAPPVDEPFDADDWIARATGGRAKAPRMPQGPDVTPAAPLDPWGDAVRSAQTYATAPYTPRTTGDVAQKKLIAGLLGIFLGWLGVHKFYLGLTGPGAVMLGVQLGVWVLAVFLGLLLFIVGLALTLPLAALVSAGVGVLGLIEGIIYLTKSDADFEREYLIGRKNWL